MLRTAELNFNVKYLMIKRTTPQKHIRTASTENMLESSATDTSMAVIVGPVCSVVLGTNIQIKQFFFRRATRPFYYLARRIDRWRELRTDERSGIKRTTVALPTINAVSKQ